MLCVFVIWLCVTSRNGSLIQLVWDGIFLFCSISFDLWEWKKKSILLSKEANSKICRDFIIMQTRWMRVTFIDWEHNSQSQRDRRGSTCWASSTFTKRECVIVKSERQGHFTRWMGYDSLGEIGLVRQIYAYYLSYSLSERDNCLGNIGGFSFNIPSLGDP